LSSRVLASSLALFMLVMLGGLKSPRSQPRDAADSDVPLPFVQRQAQSMATRVVVLLEAGDQVDKNAGRVFKVFEYIDRTMSEWKDTSPLSQVNQQAGEAPVALDPSLIAILGRSILIAERTSGAFDPTWAALWGLWDFRSASPKPPNDKKIEAAISAVDYRKLRVDSDAGTAQLLERDMIVGLGGIAKGYALDCSAEELRSHGIANFLISAGGQVYASGLHEGRPWRVGIRDPRGSEQDFFALLEVADKSVSTSGDYERFFVEDGIRYHHILDPRTGRPARGLRSATVVSSDATLADALSTALMVLGSEEGLALATRWEGVEAVLVDQRGAVLVTPGLEETLIRVHPPLP
jgi:FAD:protein FMN transferase